MIWIGRRLEFWAVAQFQAKLTYTARNSKVYQISIISVSNGHGAKWTSSSMQVAVTEERVVVFPLSENERDVGSVDGPDRQAEPDIPSGKTK